MPSNLFVVNFPREVQAHTVFVNRREKPRSKWRYASLRGLFVLCIVTFRFGRCQALDPTRYNYDTAVCCCLSLMSGPLLYCYCSMSRRPTRDRCGYEHHGVFFAFPVALFASRSLPNSARLFLPSTCLDDFSAPYPFVL